MASTLTADNGSISGSSGLKWAGDASGVLALQTGAGTNALVLNANGSATFSNNIIFNGGTNGILFNNNTSGVQTESVLNDYETGTWTPGAAAQSGTLTSYTSGGYYTKVGNLVTVFGYIRIGTPGTAANDLIINNLPFAVANNSGYFRNLGTANESQNTGTFYQSFTYVSNTIYVATPSNGGITWTTNYTYNFQIAYNSTF